MGNSSGYTREIDHHKKIITGKRGGDTMTSERQLLRYCVCKRVLGGRGGEVVIVRSHIVNECMNE